MPVVVGVGHERDESLADFVADIRASTPSNAAERVFPDQSQITYELTSSIDVMESRLRRRLEMRQGDLRHAGHAMTVFFERLLHVTSDLSGRFTRAFAERLFRAKESVARTEQVLRQVDPKRVLARGYGLVSLNGVLVKDALKLELGVDVQVQLARGSFDSKVIKVRSPYVS